MTMANKHILLSRRDVLLAATAQAQIVSVTGRIESVALPPACAASATHKLKDTEVFLRSTAVDLTTISVITQVFTGTDVSAGCPLIDVTAVTNSSYTVFPCNATSPVVVESPKIASPERASRRSTSPICAASVSSRLSCHR